MTRGETSAPEVACTRPHNLIIQIAHAREREERVNRREIRKSRHVFFPAFDPLICLRKKCSVSPPLRKKSATTIFKRPSLASVMAVSVHGGSDLSARRHDMIFSSHFLVPLRTSPENPHDQTEKLCSSAAIERIFCDFLHCIGVRKSVSAESAPGSFGSVDQISTIPSPSPPPFTSSRYDGLAVAQ